MRRKTYTGFLKFREVDFSFVFSDDELKLFPTPDKIEEIRFKWLMKEIQPGTFVSGDPLHIEETSIIGTCNELGGTIVFLPHVGSYIASFGNMIGETLMLKISINALVLYRFTRDTISRITFMGPEINYIHPVNQAFSWTYDADTTDNGVFKIETHDFSSTTTKEQKFFVDGKIVKSKFGITRGISMKIGDTPLSLKSSLIFEFEPNDDYQFILNLCRIAKAYISFLCYRSNIVFDDIELSAPYKGGKYESFASIHFVETIREPEEKALKDGRCIKQVRIIESEDRILQDIADNNLYLRHLPISYESGRHIDASRFIMITAAFEWEFRRVKPEGLQKSEKRRLAEEAANAEIDKLICSRSGKEKDIYKFLKKLVEAASLQNELVAICEELNSIIEVFGKRLYSLNGEELVYSDMGKRLSDQRNHYAHGDIDKDFIGKSLLDLIFLEYVIYAMQLKYYGTTDEGIKKAINELFHLNFAI